MNFVIKLLSAPLPSDTSGQGGQFSGYISMINPLLFGLCRIDIVYIISVYGMVSSFEFFSLLFKYPEFCLNLNLLILASRNLHITSWQTLTSYQFLQNSKKKA